MPTFVSMLGDEVEAILTNSIKEDEAYAPRMKDDCGLQRPSLASTRSCRVEIVRKIASRFLWSELAEFGVVNCVNAGWKLRRCDLWKFQLWPEA